MAGFLLYYHHLLHSPPPFNLPCLSAELRRKARLLDAVNQCVVFQLFIEHPSPTSPIDTTQGERKFIITEDKT